MDKRTVNIASQIILSIAAIIALTWGVSYNWPDNVHVRHGLPLTWGTHTLVTIAGPADAWRVNIVNLVLDLALWLGLILLINIYLRWKNNPQGP